VTRSHGRPVSNGVLTGNGAGALTACVPPGTDGPRRGVLTACAPGAGVLTPARALHTTLVSGPRTAGSRRRA